MTAPPPVVAAGRLVIEDLPTLKLAAAKALALGDGYCVVTTLDRSAPDTAEVFSRLREVIVRHRWQELATGALGSVAQAVHTDEDLRRITAATLVFCGDEDMPTFIANAGRLGRVLPDCRVVPVRAAGHLCLLERPADVTAALSAHPVGPTIATNSPGPAAAPYRAQWYQCDSQVPGPQPLSNLFS